MMNKATHKGHCQACGRLQALPNGQLALHGYKVTDGYFSGVCCGSKHLPFEVSCDMLPGFIKAAQAALAQVEKKQAQLRVKPTEAIGWVQNYEGPAGWHAATYVWRQVTVDAELKSFGESSWMSYSYTAPGPRGAVDVKHKIETYGTLTPSTKDESIAVAHKMNGDKARWMEKEASNLRRYIAWQQERVDTWKPAALLPVDAKDKLGFEVKE